MPLPAGPDRGVIGLGCVFLQTPRWLAMALVLGVCVARGAFAWPESRPAQFAIVLGAHAVLGFAAICAGLAGLGMTQGIPDWLSRILALSTIVVPAIQIAFGAWFLIPSFHKQFDPVAMRQTTNTMLAVFAGTVALFAIAGLAACVLSTADTRSRHAASDAEKKAKQLAKQEQEDREFNALTPASPLADWMALLDYPHTEEHQRAAGEAIFKRPNLGRDLSEVIASDDAWASMKAMYLVDKISPPPIEVEEAVRGVARNIIKIAETIDPASPGSRMALYNQVHGLANGVMTAAEALHRVGIDLRPELREIAEVCGPREQDPPRDIQSGCERTMRNLENHEQARVH